MRWCLPSILVLVLAGACSEDASSGPRGIVHPRTEHGYPADDVLRMNHVQVKASHNSYHVETLGNTEPSWRYTQAPLAEQLERGVRAFELDTRYVAEADRFEVYHLPLLDEQTTCRAFVDCLRALRTWSDAHRGHAPLMVQIEPKDLPDSDDPEAWFGKLEREILAAWPRERIVTPDDIQRDAPTLRDAVAKRGWLTLGESRGTILFYVDNEDAFRKAYTRDGTSLEGRLMFVDSSPGDPLAAIALRNDPGDQAGIAAAVRDNLIVRTFADSAGSAEERDLALASGAHILSSDAPDAWTVPGGTPSRCNPLAAPPSCTPAAIEDPSRLR